jgi:hypothetical protein
MNDGQQSLVHDGQVFWQCPHGAGPPTPERGVDDLNGHGHEGPAAMADLGAVAAAAHVVVVRHVDIEDQLALQRLERVRLDRVVVLGLRGQGK